MENILIKYNEIKIREKLLLKKGTILIKNNGINLIQGNNGIGKSLFLSLIKSQTNYEILLMSQKNSEIIPSLSIYDNITMTLENKDNIIQIQKLLQEFGMLYLLDRTYSKMSGGEKRIIALIRALVSDANIILMDEPTNDLDYKKVEVFLKLLKRKCITKTFIIVSHDERLIPLSDNRFIITEKKLKLIESNINQEQEMKTIKTIKLKQSGNQKKNNIRNLLNDFLFINYGLSFFKSKLGQNSIEKVFGYNISSLLLLLLSLYFVFNGINDIRKESFQYIESINDNQVEIFSPLTRYMDNYNSALPFKLLDFILEMENLPTRNEIDNLIDDIVNSPLDISVQLLSNENFEVLPIEFWQQNRRKFWDPFERYIKEYLNSGLGHIYIDTSNYFSGNWMFNFSSEGVPNVNLDIDILKEMIEQLVESESKQYDPLMVTYAVIILDENVGFLDFLSSDELNEIRGKNFFIRSNFVIQLLNQINSIDLLRDLRRTSIVIFIITTFTLLFSNSLFFINNKNNICILRNYGFESEVIRQALLRKYFPLKLLFLGILTPILFNLSLLFNTNLSTSILAYLPGIAISLSFLISYYFTRNYSFFFIRKIYKWNSR